MRPVNLNGKTIFVTGAAGFIGAALCRRLLEGIPEVRVIGIDSMNDYYDPVLKEARLDDLKPFPGFTSLQGDIADREFVFSVFAEYRPAVVVNLAAQAGVRHSEKDPDTYIDSNMVGFFRILEGCRKYPVEHLVYASSSSVYGNTQKIPFATKDRTDSPISLYAATKKCDELMAHVYGCLYQIPTTGLRLFTVYGPYGRPDMAYFSFADKMVAGEKIQLFNYGNCQRDFTYIDEVVEGICQGMRKPPAGISGEDGTSEPPCAVYNIGTGCSYRMMDVVEVLREELIRACVITEDFDLDSHKELLPMQPGDVLVTCADMSEFDRDFGYRPSTSLREGLQKFAEWYRKGNPL